MTAGPLTIWAVLAGAVALTASFCARHGHLLRYFVSLIALALVAGVFLWVFDSSEPWQNQKGWRDVASLALMGAVFVLIYLAFLGPLVRVRAPALAIWPATALVAVVGWGLFIFAGLLTHCYLREDCL